MENLKISWEVNTTGSTRPAVVPCYWLAYAATRGTRPRVFDRSTDSRGRLAGGSTFPVCYRPTVRWLLRVKEILNLGSFLSECVSMATIDVLMLELSHRTILALFGWKLLAEGRVALSDSDASCMRSPSLLRLDWELGPSMAS